MKKILVGCPTFDHRIDCDWFLSIFFAAKERKYDLEFNFPRSSLLAWSRNAICKFALENKIDYVFFYDSDIAIYEKDFLDKLLNASNYFGADIVCGEYCMKGSDGTKSVLAERNEATGDYENLRKINAPRLIDAGGTGIMLVKADVLKKVEDPWFTITDLPGAVSFPEDFNFCRRAQAKGIKIAGVPMFTKHYGLYGWETR